LRFLGRGPVGAQAEVTFRNRDAFAPTAVILIAVAAAPREINVPTPVDTIFGSAVETRRLPSGFGYIRIKFELPTLRDGFSNDMLRLAVARFVAEDVPGVIVDLRDNLGGGSALSAGILALFEPHERVFQYLGLFDPATGGFRPATSVPLMIEPAQPQYHGRVAVLIDNYSHSSAEDLALVLKDLPNGTVVGLSGSHGSGGVGSKSVMLPGGFTFTFPKAQSLDGTFTIRIDSDGEGRGGVEPDIRVPLDDAAVDAHGAGRDIVLERAEDVLRQQAARLQPELKRSDMPQAIRSESLTG
jgi:carboxyl-terminal processing protease